MKHLGTVELCTDRLLLRKFTEYDATNAFYNWMSDEKVTEFLRWPTHHELAISERIIADWIKSYENNHFYQWAIALKKDNLPIGTISVVEQNDALGILHIGYCIGSKWWHQGITSEAFGVIIPFLFDKVGVNRIESQHDPRNPHSGKVMLKCGLQYEGTLRQADINNKGICDAAMYSLLADGYYSRK